MKKKNSPPLEINASVFHSAIEYEIDVMSVYTPILIILFFALSFFQGRAAVVASAHKQTTVNYAVSVACSQEKAYVGIFCERVKGLGQPSPDFGFESLGESRAYAIDVCLDYRTSIERSDYLFAFVNPRGVSSALEYFACIELLEYYNIPAPFQM